MRAICRNCDLRFTFKLGKGDRIDFYDCPECGHRLRRPTKPESDADWRNGTPAYPIEMGGSLPRVTEPPE